MTLIPIRRYGYDAEIVHLFSQGFHRAVFMPKPCYLFNPMPATTSPLHGLQEFQEKMAVLKEKLPRVYEKFPLAARKAYLELSMFLGFTYGVKEGFIFKCRLVYLWALRHLIISPFQIHIYPLFEFHDRDMMWVFYRCVPLRQFDETMIIQLYSLQQYIQYAVCSFQHIGATTFHDLDLVISILH